MLQENTLNLTQRLKESVIRSILNVKADQLDIPYLKSGHSSWTRRELANELQNDSEVGIQMLEKILAATLDKFERE